MGLLIQRLQRKPLHTHTHTHKDREWERKGKVKRENQQKKLTVEKDDSRMKIYGNHTE